jgi:hypothetical protein
LAAFVIANIGIALAGTFSDSSTMITLAAWGLPALVLAAWTAWLFWRTRS